MAVNLAMAILFVLSLILSIVVPELSYYTLFLLGITGLVARLLDRLLGVRRPPK
jgi:hypothetical protein